MKPNRYLSLDGENIVISEDGEKIARFPLHNFDSIVTFGYPGVSPALMGACARKGIDISFMSRTGKMLARVTGQTTGNVTLRREQYRIADYEDTCIKIARSMIIGKIYNEKWVLERTRRDHPDRIDCDKFVNASAVLSEYIKRVRNVENTEAFRGIEGKAANSYFECFDDMILQQKENFFFRTRNRRPPLDNINALLSFSYSLLASMCTSALETVGLDPCVGFMHKERPGRPSLALDLMEELRAPFADRFVLSLVNKKVIKPNGFVNKENGAVIMDDDTRKLFISSWQERKQQTIVHPFLEEKVEWGIVPFVQALLLARYIRGDLDAYPPFMWK